MFSRSEKKQIDIQAGEDTALPQAVERVREEVVSRIDPTVARRRPRGDLATEVREIASEIISRDSIDINRLELRNLVTAIVNGLLTPNDDTPDSLSKLDEPETVDAERATGSPPSVPEPTLVASTPNVFEGNLPTDENIAAETAAEPSTELVKSEDVAKTIAELNDGLSNLSETLFDAGTFVSAPIEEAKSRVQPVLLERIDIAAATEMPRADLARQVTEIVGEILFEERLRLNLAEQRDLVTMLINDMLGLGPLEPLLSDETVTDIMVNGANQIYVERKGKLELTNVRFRDDAHVMNIATRIVTKIGRRVDESQPLVDARLEDGSRVNIIMRSSPISW